MKRIARAGLAPRWISLALTVGAGFVAHAAQAQECQSDDDCGPAFRCDLPPTSDQADVSDGSSGSGSGSSGGSSASGGSGGAASADSAPSEGDATDDTKPKGDPVPAAAEDPAAAEGSDSDCAGGGCMVAEEPAPTGRCEQDGIACSSNTDCPEPATCEAAECVYRLVKCTADSECDSGYVCTEIDEGRCSSSESTPQAAPGADVDSATNQSKPAAGAPETDEAGPEPGTPAAEAPVAPPIPSDDDVQCEPVGVSACFPKLVECTSDDDCSAGWKCTAVPPGGPDAWDDVERACFPPGLIAALAEQIEFVGDAVGGSSGSEADGMGTIGSPVKGDDGQSPTPSPVPEEDLNPNLGTQGGSEGNAGAAGCSMGSAPNAGPTRTLPGLGLLLGGLALLLRRKPNQRTP